MTSYKNNNVENLIELNTSLIGLTNNIYSKCVYLERLKKQYHLRKNQIEENSKEAIKILNDELDIKEKDVNIEISVLENKLMQQINDLSYYHDLIKRAKREVGENNAEDYVQDTLIRVLRFIRRNTINKSLRNLLVTALYNLIRTGHRKIKNNLIIDDRVIDNELSFNEENNLIRSLDRKDITEDNILNYLSQMNGFTEEDRAIFILRENLKLSVEEISYIFNLPKHTITNRQFKTRNKLKAIFKGYY